MRNDSEFVCGVYIIINKFANMKLSLTNYTFEGYVTAQFTDQINTQELVCVQNVVT